uniref:Calx-beta domain-containing protein n=1 Tax=Parascaris equorum TaxID=6256 RepID=A0A914SEJ8_PAREQ
MFRGALFFLIIAYCFLGVSIVADRFMSSIEPGTDGARSSAPEILLSIIEVIGKGFEAGDLGPNTIVGSAAFNLFMIIAICVMAVPSTEIRRQKHLDVFCVTATWSLFAYIWMYLILSVFSPGIIEIWEGKRFLPHRYRRTSRCLVASEGEEMKMLEGNGIVGDGVIDPALKAFDDNRQTFIEIMREIRKKNPNIDPVELQKQAEYEMISPQEKQARENTCRIYFDPALYTVLENIGTFDVVVGRDGGPEGLTIMVDYFTEDGTANAGSDYVAVKGTLTFYPEDKQQRVTIEIVDDDVFEEDEHFFLHLKNLRVRTKDGLIIDPMRIGGVPVAALEMPPTATIMILGKYLVIRLPAGKL